MGLEISGKLEQTETIKPGHKERVYDLKMMFEDYEKISCWVGWLAVSCSPKGHREKTQACVWSDGVKMFSKKRLMIMDIEELQHLVRGWWQWMLKRRMAIY